jgi:hypothetical protein
MSSLRYWRKWDSLESYYAAGCQTNFFADFEQRVFKTFKDGFVFLRGRVIFAVSHIINNAFKLSHYMDQIKEDFSTRKFF